ncbi:MarR family transcriptional regulator [Mycolicibacterium pallens]
MLFQVLLVTNYDSGMGEWTFLTNHAHTLLCIARDPGIRLRDVAERVGVTERAAQRIVADLVEAGYLDRLREGRRNYYRIRADRPLRHPVEHGHRIGEILAVLHESKDSTESS